MITERAVEGLFIQDLPSWEHLLYVAYVSPARGAQVNSNEFVSDRSQKKVAFSAHFSIDVIKDIGPGKTIIFDTAAFNIANGYDPATGIFR